MATSLTRNYSIKKYLDRVYSDINPQHQFKAETKQDWKIWKGNLKAKLIELLGGFPQEKCPLKPEILERIEEENYWREKVVFNSREDVSIPAYILIPKGIEKNGKAK
ncbi:MAG: hypothetical protein KAT86_01050, partial [Candidatus Latescibacteria bacterium]|nr:hypothetical protein [Candidatus Latescibacterota bacterium]